MSIIHPFSPATLENLANAIADIDPDITGTVIHRLLLQSNIEDVSANEQFMAYASTFPHGQLKTIE